MDCNQIVRIYAKNRCRKCYDYRKKRIYYRANAERLRAYSRAWLRANKDRALATQKAWSAKNWDRHHSWRLAYYRAQRAADPAKYQERDRRKRLANIEAARRRDRKSYLVHRAQRIAKSVFHARKRSLLKQSIPCTFTYRDWRECKIVFQSRCAYCLKVTPRLTQDHLTPLTLGGHHSAENIVPACFTCNRRKGISHWMLFRPSDP